MEKGYGINLKFGIMQKRLWFMGKDDKETENNWKIAVNNIEDIAKNSSNFNDFLISVKENFSKYKFNEYKL